MDSQHGPNEAARAQLLLALLALVWGLNWPIMKIALDELSVWAMRAMSYTVSSIFLFAVILLQRRSARIPRGAARWHVLIASVFNLIGFGLFASFAQISATTSRVAIVNYSMPIWSSLLAWLLLGERLDGRTLAGLALCVTGLSTLIYPVAAAHSALGLMLALGCSLCWAFGTLYMKWARIPGDLMAIVAWQMVAAAIVFGAGFLIFRGVPQDVSISVPGALAVLYNGVIGNGVAFILWFMILDRLSTAAASLGSLATPVVGVLGSMVMLSERPTLADIIGFALISAAAACVLVRPRARLAREVKEPKPQFRSAEK